MNEVTAAQKARLGLFLIISGGLLVIIILIITGSELLEKRDTYFVRYKDTSVSGLEIGAQVKYHGVRVGRIEDIYIDEDQVDVVVVELSLKAGTPIKTDVEAEISALSLTGLKIIELTGGSRKAPMLPPGSEIPPGESTLQMITGKAEAVSEKLELALTNLVELTGGENQERLMKMIDNTALVLNDFHVILKESREPVQNIVRNLEEASIEIHSITSSTEIKRTLSNLDTASANIAQTDIVKMVSELQKTLEEIRLAFNHVDLTVLKGRHDFLMSLEVLRESLDSFNEFTRIIAEDPSLLLRGTREQEIGIGR